MGGCIVQGLWKGRWCSQGQVISTILSRNNSFSGDSVSMPDHCCQLWWFQSCAMQGEASKPLDSWSQGIVTCFSPFAIDLYKIFDYLKPPESYLHVMLSGIRMIRWPWCLFWFEHWTACWSDIHKCLFKYFYP